MFGFRFDDDDEAAKLLKKIVSHIPLKGESLRENAYSPRLIAHFVLRHMQHRLPRNPRGSSSLRP